MLTDSVGNAVQISTVAYDIITQQRIMQKHHKQHTTRLYFVL